MFQFPEEEEALWRPGNLMLSPHCPRMRRGGCSGLLESAVTSLVLLMLSSRLFNKQGEVLDLLSLFGIKSTTFVSSANIRVVFEERIAALSVFKKSHPYCDLILYIILKDDSVISCFCTWCRNIIPSYQIFDTNISNSG